ncbi:hypothetical protein DFQ05_0929 [Winogradskyella wandonensis]|uniref:Uncharacterized protein n=1 Tax=Winogradskyella wandonensis TaxID=1442586 RepID=A0A4R1KW40_9FLAO|nr:hypothetical protein [Winogradskyella wandonensis]TCK69408.1 hypothetical protein DFQ05_0929 [Winogradskyella wandonensis]
MDSNYIPKHTKQSESIISNIKSKKQDSIAIKEKRSAIYAAFLFLIIMASITIFSASQGVIFDHLAISLFIISCILLIKMSGPTKQA